MENAIVGFCICAHLNIKIGQLELFSFFPFVVQSKKNCFFIV